jgi:hypothetical protein
MRFEGHRLVMTKTEAEDLGLRGVIEPSDLHISIVTDDPADSPSLREQLGAIRTAISNVPRSNTVVVNRLLNNAYDLIGTVQLLTADDDRGDDE